MQSNIMDNNFVAIKVGDINSSAVANSLAGSNEDRTGGTLFFDVADKTVQAGEVFDVTLRAAEEVLGFQFTLNFPGLAIQEVTPGPHMSSDHFGVFANDHLLTVSADHQANEFTVRFRAMQSRQVERPVECRQPHHAGRSVPVRQQQPAHGCQPPLQRPERYIDKRRRF